MCVLGEKMLKSLIICSIAVLLMITSIIVKPYVVIKKFKFGLYSIIVLFFAILCLILGALPFSVAIEGITQNTPVNPLKILALFISLSLISVYLGDSGFFTMIAQKLFEKNNGSVFKLFLTLYIVVSVLTLFTSNDIIILTFTPLICIFCENAKISPVPFLFGEFISANTLSMGFIIGNPTNLYLAGSNYITFFEYFKVMFVPTLVSGTLCFFALVLIFRKQLFGVKMQTSSKHKIVPVRKAQMLASLSALILTIIALSISDILGIESYLICVIAFLLLTITLIVIELIEYKSITGVLHSLKKAPYELIPFVLSMFILVLSLEYSGITKILGEKLITGSKLDALSFGFLSSLSANLLNNIPMSVLFEKIINGGSVYALFGSIIGSNIGAFITPVGALAGIMWTKILASFSVKISFKKFISYGVLPALVALLSSVLVLLII
jgi:arsenical pump membrane protein